MPYDELKQILARGSDVSDGMAALLASCRERYPDPTWDLMGALDYGGAADDLRAWLLEQTIPDAVEVIWFAMWDVTTGFDLRGSTSWSRDPENWDWWFHDDFAAGSYQPPILGEMHELARQVEDPNAGPTPTGGVSELTDLELTLGFVTLAAAHALSGLAGPADIGRNQELSAVSGHPDEVYGIILGRLSEAGFEPFKT